MSSSSIGSSKERKVICRACPFENEIYLKNYERHLIRFHPQENSKDPRGKGSRVVTLTTLFWNQKRKQEEEQEEAEAAGPSPKKLRHSSGDSGLGVPETEQDTDPEVISVSPRDGGTTGPGVPETDQDTDPEVNSVSPREGGTTGAPHSSSQEEEAVKEVSNSDILRKLLENQEEILKRLDDSSVLVSKSESTVKTVFPRGGGTTGSDEAETAGPDLRSVTDVEDFEKFGFKVSHDGESSSLSCVICEAEFKYSGPQNVHEEKLPREFRNLKSHIKQHFFSKRHLDKVEENRKEGEAKNYLVSRDQKAGKNLTRAAYCVIKSRNPEMQFEREVYLMYTAGGEVGNLNHSKHFIPKIRPHLASSVRKLRNQHLTSPMSETGLLPPFGLSADGATWLRY